MVHFPRPTADQRQRLGQGIVARTISISCICALAGTTACNDDGGLSTLKPRMEVMPEAGTALVFEQVVLTRTTVGPQVVKVRNSGDGPLVIEGASIDADEPTSFFVSDRPQTILPGQTDEVYVRFDPTGPGAQAATLTINSNDPERRVVTFPVQASAIEPCVLFADQSRMIFRVGDVQELTLTSVSTSECVVDRLFTDRTTFPILDEPDVPFTIGAGQSVKLRIEHRAASTQYPGVPVRELEIRETEGSELKVLLEGEAPLFGCLSAFPLEILYPQTERGQTRRQRVTINNECGRAATLISVVVSRGWTAFEVEGTYPTTVPPGGRTDVWIKYIPATEDDKGRITINTNDAANPRFRVAVFGTAAIPDVEAFPYALDFGTVIHRNPAMQDQRSECASAARVANIHSTGSAPVTIQRLEVDGARDGVFEVTGVTVDGVVVPDFNSPFQIPVNKSAQVVLQFFPTRAMPEDHASVLRIHNNGRDELPAEIRLNGTATTDGPVTDTFRQLEGPKVDILWVIDNSCSMYDEQARLVDNLTQFVAYADSLNADYQMGVIVTDSRSPEAGKLQFCYPHPRIVKSDYPRRDEAFRCLFEVGVTGSYIEAGLGAAMKALQRAQRTDDDPIRNPNIGFLRDDASLAVVTMSDEDDQSLESDDLLVDFFRTVNGNNRTTVHAIAGPVAETCQTRQAMAGYRYFWMTEQMGGLFQNICLEDWQPVLRNLGLNVFVPIEEWELSQSADPTSVTVSVDGRPIIWSQNNGYTYSASRNRIQFHGTSVPTPGQTITVSYVGNCRP